MIVRPGQTLLWKLTPFCGSVMVKGQTEAGLIELYHMEQDEFFSVPPDEYSKSRTLLFKDESLRVTNPKQWLLQSAIWIRAYQRCGIPRP